MTFSAFILAAGKGTRLHPFSLNIPKPMLPIINKPIIFHSIKRLLKAGIANIGVVIRKNDHIIPSYIRKTFPELQSPFIVQEEALGTAHAVLQVKKCVSTENFLVIAGDSLFSASYLRKLRELHMEENNEITLSLEKMEFNLMRYSSTVDYRDGRVWKVLEKPETPADVLSDLNAAALYIFSSSFFSTLEDVPKSKRGEYELISAINNNIRKGERVGGLITKRVCHISTSYDLWRFNLQFLKRTKKNKINGNIIGENVSLDDSTIIENTILGNNSVISKGVALKNCVIFPNTTVDQNFENSLVKSNYYECYSNISK